MNKRTWAWTLVLFGIAVLLVTACATKPKADYPVTPVSLTDVRFTDGFWGKRQEIDRTVTIPHNFKECEETGRIKNFEIAGGAAQGAFCSKYAFDDSDVYKVIEAAAYSLALHPDAELEKYIDRLAAKIGAAQEPDGYLYTARTIDAKNPPQMSGPERWSNLPDSHELYVVGHFYEAAAAHYAATGKRNLLDIALRSADFIAKTFGPGEKQLKLVPGHEEIEIGLVKLYRTTGKKKYLDLAKFFIDQRGNAAGHKLYGEYAQDHKPVLEQTEAVGHAVRAAYLYSGMADIAALTGDKRYMDALDTIWEDVVTKKLYLTGGIGAAGSWEGFGPAYDLPNATGYAETCATIAYALWNWRMSLYHADAKYMDLFERAAYNAFLSGAGMSGDLFFYPNPLASFGQHQRTPWFGCACCPPNVARFIAELGGFAYGVDENKIYVNLYGQGTANITTKAGKVTLEQTTDYPWTGDIKIGVAPEKPADLTLMVRVPGWAVGKPLPGDLYRYAGETKGQPVIKVNGEAVALNIEKGYVPVTRTWQKGDTVEISLSMEARRVLANDKLKSDAGLVAVERGPLVYCAEFSDNGGRVTPLILEDGAALTAEARPDLLNGLTVITAEGAQKITLIPYYAWAHRGRGEMEVWLPREAAKARPLADPTLEMLSSRTLKPVVTVDAAKTLAPMSKYIYGQFIEHLGRCIYQGIWAEMLEDRKFYYPVDDKESPWKAVGEAGNVRMNPIIPYVGVQAPEVRIKGNGDAGGIAQDNLALIQGRDYVGRVVLAGDPGAAPIEVSLVWGPGANDRQTVRITEFGTDYRTFLLAFKAGTGTETGRLEIASHGSESFRVGTISLMPADNVQGFRPEVLEVLKKLDSPVYRWPGGNFVSGYDWKDGIGDPDKRPPRKNPAWLGVEHNDVGIHEYQTFCRLIGTEPYISINSGQGNETPAADMVEYVNGAASTPMGKLRAKNGRVEPWGCPFWSIGNEMYGDWQLGSMPLKDYIKKHNRFAAAMLARDPSIKLVGVGATGEWDEGMMSECANAMDLISEHFYCQEGPDLLSHVNEIPNEIRRIADAHRAYRKTIPALKGKDIRIALDEWNYWYGPHLYGELGTQYFLKDALGIAAGINEYARQSDIIFMANYAQTVNVIGAIKTNKTEAILDSTGVVLALYRERFGTLPVKVSGAAAPFDVMATWREGKKVLTVSIVNPTHEKQALALKIKGVDLPKTATLWLLTGTDEKACNVPGKAPQVEFKETKDAPFGGKLVIPPMSVSLYELEAK